MASITEQVCLSSQLIALGEGEHHVGRGVPVSCFILNHKMVSNGPTWVGRGTAPQMTASDPLPIEIPTG